MRDTNKHFFGWPVSGYIGYHAVSTAPSVVGLNPVWDNTLCDPKIVVLSLGVQGFLCVKQQCKVNREVS